MEHAVGFLILAALLVVIFGAGLARLTRRVGITLRLGFRRYRRAKLRRSMPALLLATLAITALAVLVAAFLDDDGGLGPTGDFFGGLMNPLIAAAALLALLKTIQIQQTELRMTREELARSSEALDGQRKLYEQQLFNQVFAEALSDLDAALAAFAKIKLQHESVKTGGTNFQEALGKFRHVIGISEIYSSMHKEEKIFSLLQDVNERLYHEGFNPTRVLRAASQACVQACSAPKGAKEAYKRITLRMSHEELACLYFFAFSASAAQHVVQIINLEIPEIVGHELRMPKRFGDPTELLRLAHSRSASNPSVNGSNS